MSVELLPCPFCGKKPQLLEPDDSNKLWSVSCLSCVSIDLEELTEERAIQKWNTRHYPAEVQQAVDKQKPELAIITKEKEYHPMMDVYEVGCPDCENVLRYELPKGSSTNRNWHCMDCGKKMNVRIDAEVEDE